MKSKLTMKILGIVVTVATLSSLLVGLTAAPVSAAVGTMGYGGVSAPSNVGNVLGGVVYNVGMTGFDITSTPKVNFLEGTVDGTTMFAWDNTNAMLYTSTNAGVSWTPRPWTGTNLTALATTVIKLLVSPNFATDNTIVLVTPATLWISTNGGGSFSATPAPDVEGGVITSADIGIAYNDGNTPSVIVGMTSTGAGGLFSNVEKFKLAGSYAWSQIGGLTGLLTNDFSVYGVAFSKSNGLDAEIIAVIDSVLGAPSGTPTLASSYTNAVFGNKLTLAGTCTGATKAVIALGSDYNGYTAGNTLAVGLSGAGALGNNVWRVTGRSSGNFGTALFTNVTGGPVAITDINVIGTMATGTVLVGTATSSTVYRNSTFPAGTSVTYSGDTKAPTGTAVSSIYAAGANAFVGTTGTDGGVFVSANAGANWNGLSLLDLGAPTTAKTIDNMSITSLYALDNSNMFLIMGNSTVSGNAAQQLWVTANGGSIWTRVLIAGQLGCAVIGSVAPSPAYATDKTFWVSQGTAVGAGSAIFVTNDNGTTFTPMIASANQTAIKATSGTTFYYGGAAVATFYKFGRWSSGSFPAGTAFAVSSFAFNPTDTTNATIAAALTDGNVYLSTNDGVSFTKLASGGTIVSYGPDGSLYATNGTVIRRWVASTSSFLDLQTITPLTAINGLAVTKDGTLYASDGTIANGVWRSLYPTTGSATSTITLGGIKSCEFQTLPSSAFTNSAANLYIFTGLNVVNTATDNTLYVIATNNPATAGLTSGSSSGYVGSLMGFKDNFILAAAATAPANGAVLTTKTSAALSWPTYTNATGYQVAVNDASAFNGVDFTGLDPTAASAPNTTNLTYNNKGNLTSGAMASGTTYSWRVRANTVANGGVVGTINSRWSTGASFTTAMVTPADLNPVQAMTPVQGAVNVDVNTTFSWPAVAGATYEFVIAEELGNADKFAIIDYSATTPTNATPLRETLKYNTQYWWRVRAVNGTSTSAWTVGFFTTESAPVVTSATTTTQAPPTTIIVPTQTIPTPTVTVINSGNQNNTPVIPSALLWAIIAIGAVLIIAVIVLIVRTRKI